MRYINIKDIDIENTFFHFTRIDNRESIKQNGLQAVASGESKLKIDQDYKAIYFSKGNSGLLKNIDVWTRLEFKKYIDIKKDKLKEDYDYKNIMNEIIFDKLYNDFKDRQYYSLELIEGEDFKYNDIDFKKLLLKDESGRPNNNIIWMYGEYSNFGTKESPNHIQEEWNMCTKIGKRIIPNDRLRIIENEQGRSDALSVILELYDNYRDDVLGHDNDNWYKNLDQFVLYAKRRYENDPDFKNKNNDIGRRPINIENEIKFQKINKIELENKN